MRDRKPLILGAENDTDYPHSTFSAPSVSFMNLVYILLFGMAGVLARYFVGAFVTQHYQPLFPYATFGINILGSFLIGVIYVLAVERAALSPELRLGLMVGFLGGFTTFSSYCLETVRLIEEAQYISAALYFTLSPMLGVGATLIGILVVRRLMGAIVGA